jgi:hypothetical protein
LGYIFLQEGVSEACAFKYPRPHNLRLELATNKNRYLKSCEGVNIKVTLYNRASKDLDLYFFKPVELVIFKNSKEKVFVLSRHTYWKKTLKHLRIKSHSSVILLNWLWNQTDDQGDLVKEGVYTIRANLFEPLSKVSAEKKIKIFKLHKCKFQKGFILDLSFDPKSSLFFYPDFERLAVYGIDCICLNVIWPWDIKDPNTYSINLESHQGKRRLSEVIRSIHETKMRVLLNIKFLHDSSLEDRGLNRLAPEQDQILSNYEEFVLKHASFAEREEVEVFGFGQGLRMSWIRKEYFGRLIGRIRECFGGKLIFIVRQEDLNKVQFWDNVDYAGIELYLPLVGHRGIEDISAQRAFDRYTLKLQDYLKDIRKPVVFMGTFPQDKLLNKQTLPHFARLLDRFWRKPYFYGVYLGDSRYFRLNSKVKIGLKDKDSNLGRIILRFYKEKSHTKRLIEAFERAFAFVK